MKKELFLCLFALVFPAAVEAQLAVQVQKAEMAVPFGASSGTIVLVRDLLVFIDDENPQTSLALSRKNIQDIASEGEALVVQLREPIKDSAGERSRVSFRLVDEAGAGLLRGWLSAMTAEASEPEQSARAENPKEDREQLTFQVKHDHLVGGCNGRLLVGEQRVVYESVGNVGHSRQWDLSDIKEIQRKSPYHLEIVPFDKNNYTFDLQRRGMDINDYKALVDRIALARAQP